MTENKLTDEEFLKFYKSQSKRSDPGKYVYLYDDLPDSLPELCEIIQNTLIHIFWAMNEKNYGITLKDIENKGREPNKEINQANIEEKLSSFISIKDTLLTEKREPIDRVVGNCRDYSLLLVSILRHKGIPARVRSGTARYFYPPHMDHHEDHYICEYWNDKEQRWLMVDAQIDDVQRKALNMTMDTCDVPNDQFLGAGKTWMKFRKGEVEPEKLGIDNWRGEQFAVNKLIMDLASINKLEVLAWEIWGICVGDKAITEEQYSVFDQLAEKLAQSRNVVTFNELKDLFEDDSRFKVPDNHKPFFLSFKW